MKYRLRRILLMCFLVLFSLMLCACGSPSAEVEEALNEEYLLGYDEGYEDGYDGGYEDGRSDGFKAGYMEGEFDGYMEGQGDAEYGIYDPPEMP